MRSPGAVTLLVLVSSGLMLLATGCSTGSGGSPGSLNSPGSSSPAPERTGIRGVTLVDGGCPMTRTAVPCPDRPVAAKVTATLGSTVRSVVSDTAGHFELPLPPGRYQVQASSPDGSPVPLAAPRAVVVPPASFTEITIHLDSGIR